MKPEALNQRHNYIH